MNADTARAIWYVEDADGGVRPVGMEEWATGVPVVDPVVWKSDLGDRGFVSTVFLGIDHNWGDGPPVLYETMVFGGPLDEEQVRYCTRAEAAAGHDEIVRRLAV